MPRLSTVLWWLFIGFIAWMIVVNPSGAAVIAHGIGHFLSKAAHGISTFLTTTFH